MSSAANNTRQLDIDRNWGDREVTIVGSVAEHIDANCRFQKSARQPFLMYLGTKVLGEFPLARLHHNIATINSVDMGTDIKT